MTLHDQINDAADRIEWHDPVTANKLRAVAIDVRNQTRALDTIAGDACDEARQEVRARRPADLENAISRVQRSRAGEVLAFPGVGA